MKRAGKIRDFVYSGMKIREYNQIQEPPRVPSGHKKDNYFQMKNKFLVICCIALAFAGCKENDAPIDFGTAVTAGNDSTYVLPVTSIPAADPHNVLIEDFTGQSCSNCPAAHDVLEGLIATGHVNVVSLYITNFIQTTPPNGAIYDFRDSTATLICSGIYLGVTGSGIPAGGVDRVPVSSTLLLYSAGWSGAVATQKAVIDSVNLAVASSYNSSDSVATIKVTITYLKPMSTPQNISIVVVEDTMYDKQEDGTTVDNSYLFTDVYRGMVTSIPAGDAILSTMATKEAGRVYWRRYTYKLKGQGSHPAIDPTHCRVIAFVNAPGGGTGDYHVLQSVQTKLAP
jgi:hypothetical protein